MTPIPIRTPVKYTDADGAEQIGIFICPLRCDDGEEPKALVSRRAMQSTVMETLPIARLTPTNIWPDAEQIEAEIRLAALLGWTNIKPNGDALIGTPPDGIHSVRGEAMVPQWTRDWVACGALMVAYRCYPSAYGKTGIMARDIDSQAEIHLCRSDYRDMEAAIRFAVVRCVMIKLEATREAA